MKKKFLSVLLIVAVLIGMAGVSGTQTESGEQKADKEQKQQENEQTAETKVEIPLENEEEQKGWIGVILNGDETEAYTLAHIDGIRAAAENVSLPEQDIIWKERVGANDGCKSAVKDLIRQGCEIIIANSAIYEEAIKSEAEKNPEVDFVVINDSKTQSTVTEDGTELTNLYNVHMDTYEASYVAGVTAGMKVAKLKEKKNLTVITNSVELVVELNGIDGWTIILTGGRLKPDSLALVGDQTQQMLHRFHVDTAIMSCKGIDMEAAITDSNDLHAEVKHAMVRAAKQPILVVDGSKFDKVSFVSIAKLKEVSIVVTNCRPSQEWMRCFARHGIQCVFPEEK
mgnify:CR=1 FL=1